MRTPESEKWIPITIEKLPDFCYNCGRVGHVVKECDGQMNDDEQELQYGVWMRAGSRSYHTGKAKKSEDKTIEKDSGLGDDPETKETQKDTESSISTRKTTDRREMSKEEIDGRATATEATRTKGLEILLKICTNETNRQEITVVKRDSWNSAIVTG